MEFSRASFPIKNRHPDTFALQVGGCIGRSREELQLGDSKRSSRGDKDAMANLAVASGRRSFRQPGEPSGRCLQLLTSCKTTELQLARDRQIEAVMLACGASWSAIQAATGCSRSTVARLAKR
jgi:hypothetical protein